MRFAEGYAVGFLSALLAFAFMRIFMAVGPQ